jgi:hypothetical protein
MSRLVSHNGEALKLYLILLLLAQLPQPDNVLENIEVQGIPTFVFRSSWQILLAQSHLTTRQHQVRFHRALNRLAEMSLIQLPPPGSRGRYRNISLLEEGGSGIRYTPPLSLSQRANDTAIDPDARWLTTGRRRDILLLPADFYTSGWVHVLTAPEIACLLMFFDIRFRYSKPKSTSIFVPRSVRLENYSISDEVYRSHRELTEFWLLSHYSESSGRSRGRLRPIADQPLLPLEFEVRRSRLAADALAMTRGALHRQPHAPHLTNHSPASSQRIMQKLIRTGKIPSYIPIFDGELDYYLQLDDGDGHPSDALWHVA